MPTTKSLVIELAIIVGIGVVLAALGPFGSYGLGGLATRLAYWLPLVLAGYLIFRPATLAARWLNHAHDLPKALAIVTMAALASIPMTLLVGSVGPSRMHAGASIEQWFTLYLNVVLVGALICLGFIILSKRAPEAVEPPPPADRFTRRLSPGFAGPLVALEMEDHYVRAHGADGRSELILMRMRDAVRELDPATGTQVHRSWWVARDAIVGQRRDGRRLVLLLKGGPEAPVARDRVATLKGEGWL